MLIFILSAMPMFLQDGITGAGVIFYSEINASVFPK